MAEILILLTLWLIACILCFVIGFFIGLKGYKSKEVKKPLDELTEEQKRLAEKLARETENFYSYDGSNQNDFIA